ncbi:MAG: hypothetical protein JSV04_00145 [Candidatus Heimdallarchaeota archaeon]|nr:MAG: hypothetical protein JSV04_00145 [Candidatus Heimdallarchaeota archaeon]
MDISEVLFVYLGPILYNLTFISLWILWFIYHRDEENQGIKRLFKMYLRNNKWFYPITGILIIIFLYFLLGYAIIHTDVDDAITSAVQAYLGRHPYLKSHNPYQEDVVKHYTISETEPVYGRYHYFPPDLLTYSFFYLIAGDFLFPLLDTYWFFPLHLILLFPGYWLITKLVDWPHHRLIPFSLLLITPFLFTNSMLMWFFFLIGYYFYETKEKHTLGMVFYVLAASVKYMVGFIILFYFFQTIQELYKEKEPSQNWQIIGNKLSPYIISSLVLTLLSLPFGFFDVITSVFIYQGDPQYREEVAQAIGPLLIEVLKVANLKTLYLPIVGAIVILALLILIKQPTYDQIIHFSFLSMLILPFYATELFVTLPFFFWFKEGAKSFGNDSSMPKDNIDDFSSHPN